MSVLEFGDPERAVDVVFLHANGLNALTYRSLLAPLSASLRIVAPDLRGHGASRLEADPRGRRSWNDFRDDVISLLEVLGGPPVTLGGHSMGGTVALAAAARAPDRVSNLALFDPVILSRTELAFAHLPGARSLAAAQAPLIRGALRRRATFDSRADAFQSYRGRGAFATWPETVLADYVAGGLIERDDGRVELACAPRWEAANFAAQANRPWRDFTRTPRPILILRAEHGSTCHAHDDEAVRRRWPHVKLETVAGGHFFPMERPDLVRDALLDAAV
jgi:pimeloyl-ACP methyl ester carboxylesterase